HGASPDGDAGEVDITAGLDYKQPGSIFDQANGGGGCGGTMCAMVGRTFALTGAIDVSGGSCGGDMEADAAVAVSLGTTAEVSADSAQDAGTVTLNAQQITTFGKLHATGTATGALAGVVQLTGCTLSVPEGASIKSDGERGVRGREPRGRRRLFAGLSGRPLRQRGRRVRRGVRRGLGQRRTRRPVRRGLPRGAGSQRDLRPGLAARREGLPARMGGAGRAG